MRRAVEIAGMSSVRSAFARFGTLYVVLLVAIPVVLFFVFSGPLYWLWVERFEGPSLQREFGFSMETRDVTLPGGAL